MKIQIISGGRKNKLMKKNKGQEGCHNQKL
jgi:hypothetical protein